MSVIRTLRLVLKQLRRFISGFVSVVTFSHVRIEKFPFAEGEEALQQDKSEIYSDRELATKKNQTHDRTKLSQS